MLERSTVAWGLWPENVSSVRTFAVGDHSSVIDMIFACLPRGSSVCSWRVQGEVYSYSDHRNIEFSLSSAIPPPPNRRPELKQRLRGKIDMKELVKKLRSDAKVDHIQR